MPLDDDDGVNCRVKLFRIFAEVDAQEPEGRPIVLMYWLISEEQIESLSSEHELRLAVGRLYI